MKQPNKDQLRAEQFYSDKTEVDFSAYDAETTYKLKTLWTKQQKLDTNSERQRIRNQISAQESRLKKKEELYGLQDTHLLMVKQFNRYVEIVN